MPICCAALPTLDAPAVPLLPGRVGDRRVPASVSAVRHRLPGLLLCGGAQSPAEYRAAAPPGCRPRTTAQSMSDSAIHNCYFYYIFLLLILLYFATLLILAHFQCSKCSFIIYYSLYS